MDRGQDLTEYICRPRDYIESELPEVPTRINITIVYHGIQDVNEQSMIVTLKLSLNVRWKDPRLVPNENKTIVNDVVKRGKNGDEKNFWKPTWQINKLSEFHSKLRNLKS